MDAELVLQPRVGALPFHLQDDLLEPAEVRGRGREDLGLPPVPLREVAVHLQQLAGPQGRLLTARAGPDLHDHVLLVVRVLGDEQLLQPGLEGRRSLPGGPSLLAEILGHLRVLLPGGHGSGLLGLAPGVLVFAVRADDLPELGDVLAQPAQAVAIGRHVGRGHLCGEPVVALLDVREA